MRLKHKIGHPLKRAIGAERGDDVVRCPHMNVEGGDHVGQCVARRRVPAGDEVIALTAQSDIGQPQRFLTIVGGEDAWLADLRTNWEEKARPGYWSDVLYYSFDNAGVGGEAADDTGEESFSADADPAATEQGLARRECGPSSRHPRAPGCGSDRRTRPIA